jgi:hypothetical protein
LNVLAKGVLEAGLGPEGSVLIEEAAPAFVVMINVTGKFVPVRIFFKRPLDPLSAPKLL